MEYESPNPGVVSGPNNYAASSQCVSNAVMDSEVFDAVNLQDKNPGVSGYKIFMSWIKAQLIKGNQVSVGVLINGGTSAQYDHEVTVMKVGTNHGAMDSTYYDDDVLYFEDHGCFSATYTGQRNGYNPAVPPGAGDPFWCTPYIYGYNFSLLKNTRAGANQNSSYLYSIILPGATVQTQQGGDGYQGISKIRTRNWGIAIKGFSNPKNEAYPVYVTLVSTQTYNKVNPMDNFAGYNYEYPMIGNDMYGQGCTNAQPSAMTISLNVTISNLTPGSYNLYVYRFTNVQGAGSQAMLDIPTSSFNAQSNKAWDKIPFMTTSSTYSIIFFKFSSMDILAFRAVNSTAP